MDDRRAHERIDVLEVKLSSLASDIKANTVLTQNISDNTGELVQILRGAKMFRSFVLFVAPVVATCYGVIEWIRGH